MGEAFQDEVATAIERCATVVGDLDALKDALHELRLSSDDRAQFATALFDLDRARRGAADARLTMLLVADALLAFWREGTGEALATQHPVLQRLWHEASELLKTFEDKRLERLLQACWDARADATALLEAVAELQPDGVRRVEFARCLYHLELARLSVAESRAEFSARVGLLTEAYQDEAVARELIGDDAGLERLWIELLPYLDEFFELQEHRARPPEPPPPPPRPSEPRSPRPSAPRPSAPVPRFQSLLHEAPPAPPPPRELPLAARRQIDRSLLKTQRIVPPVVAGAEPPTLEPPTLEPPTFEPDTLEPDTLEPDPVDPDDGIDAITDTTPFERLPPPPPPALTPAQGVPAIDDADLLDDDEPLYEPDEATLDFWGHTFEVLQLAGGAEGRNEQRLFTTESRADRRRLTGYLDTLGPHLDVPEARAFACLVRLLLTVQTKEKGLFGQPNPLRHEAMRLALGLLSTDPAAAGRAAVWLELDGPQTREQLSKGLEVLMRYLAWCARAQQDPLDPDGPRRFANGA